jgi:nucleotide-binding universal stress UspA family protein
MMSRRPFVIVVGCDFSEQANRALKAGLEQASLNTPSELHVLHATLLASEAGDLHAGAPPAGALGGALIASLEELRQKLLKHLDAQLSRLPSFPPTGVRVFAHVLLESPVFAVTRLAEVLEASLIVVGSHGRHGVARWLLGSVAEAVVRQAACPVLVVPPLPQELPIPAIEPACPECVVTRQRASGAEPWCAQHREHHGRRHVYHQVERVSSDAALPLVVHQS